MFRKIVTAITLLWLGCLASISILVTGMWARDTYQQHGYSSQPPDYVLIKGERWYITPIDGLDVIGRYAQTSCSSKNIYYDKDLAENVLRDALWHEVYHAELCDRKIALLVGKSTFIFNPSDHRGLMTGFSNWQTAIDGEEHDIVYPLAMAQASFVHDNPGFIRWAMEWK